MLTLYRTETPCALICDECDRALHVVYFAEGSFLPPPLPSTFRHFPPYMGIDEDEGYTHEEMLFERMVPPIIPSSSSISVRFPFEKLEPIYPRSERITMFVAGCQNCGKSFFVANFLKRYRTLRPERTIYLVTGLSEKDKHFEGLPILKIKLDSEIISNITLEDLRTNPDTKERTGAIVIFDDIDRIPDKKALAAVYKFAADILSNGRDHSTQKGVADIDCIITNHELNDWNKTRTSLTECNWVVLFPTASTRKQIDLILSKIGASKKQKEEIIKYKLSRYLCIHKTFPKYCVMANKVFLLE